MKLAVKKGVQTFANKLLHMFAQPFMQNNTQYIRNSK
jgi:hypothetical protein